MRTIRILAGVAALACCGLAHAQSSSCADDLAEQSLTDAMQDADELANNFRTAFTQMTLDKSTASLSNFGATLVGSAMALEVSATAAGLRQMVHLRDQLTQPASHELAVNQLRSALGEATLRMQRLSRGYASSTKMAVFEDVRNLARTGDEFVTGLATEWSCK